MATMATFFNFPPISARKRTQKPAPKGGKRGGLIA